jgi:vacuolar-type H+-ATPase subunit I/STV1
MDDMARIISGNREFELRGFDSEAEFEKAVIANKTALFGPDVVYVDVKRLIGKNGSYYKGIPDGYLIDFYDRANPELYIVENELATHNAYSNITEQIARFTASIATSTQQIRAKILETIHGDPDTRKEIEQRLEDSPFKNIEALMLNLTEKTQIKVVIVIDESTTDLDLALNIFKDRPDVVTMQRYVNGGEILYLYEPMREELEDVEVKKTARGERPEFDTIVCGAFPEGFKHAYQQQSAWWAIRLSQDAREKIKHLAIYEIAPKSHIEHVADIERIEPYKDSGKFIVYLKNRRTIKPIPLGKGGAGAAPQGPRYTTLEKLLNAKAVSDLWQ